MRFKIGNLVCITNPKNVHVFKKGRIIEVCKDYYWIKLELSGTKVGYVKENELVSYFKDKKEIVII